MFSYLVLSFQGYITHDGVSLLHHCTEQEKSFAYLFPHPLYIASLKTYMEKEMVHC